MSINDEGTQRLKLIMAALGPIEGDTHKERMAEHLRRFDMAYGITPEDAAEIDRKHAEHMASLTDEERAHVTSLQAEADGVRTAMDEIVRDKPTIQ